MKINICDSFNGKFPSAREQKEANVRLTKLAIELGTRKNNQHIGSGIGGNNFQLLTLLSFRHVLTHESIKVKFVGKEIHWNSNYLRHSKLRKIRNDLNIAFDSLKEKHKYMALALDALPKSANFADVYEQQVMHFPKIEKIFHYGKYENILNLSLVEQLIASYLMCMKLAEQLDCGDSTNVENAGRVLYKLPEEIVVMSVRQFIGIERLIKHNLDEDPIFYKALEMKK
jgi:hypothetical protein